MTTLSGGLTEAMIMAGGQDVATGSRLIRIVMPTHGDRDTHIGWRCQGCGMKWEVVDPPVHDCSKQKALAMPEDGTYVIVPLTD